jgi:hypothetical protein
VVTAAPAGSADGGGQFREGPARPPVAHAAAAAPPARSRRGEDDDRRPRRAAAEGPPGLLIVGLCAGGGLLLLGGVVAVVLWLAWDAEPEPVAWDPAPPPVIVVPQPMPFPQIPQQPVVPPVAPGPFPPAPQPPLPQVPPPPFPQLPQPGLPGFKPPADVPANADPITRAVAALRSDDSHLQGEGVRILQGTPVDPRRRAEVARGLQAVIDNRRPFSPRNEATRALGTWGTADEVPYVLRLLNDNERGVQEAAIEALGRLKDARAADALARKMKEGFERPRAAQALKDIGPGAEAAVRRLLDVQDIGLRVDACRVLQVIGTKASYPDLLRLTNEPEDAVANAAREALPEKLRPAVWGRKLVLTLNVHVTAAHPWQQVEAKVKALADEPNPFCRARRSGDYMWVELSPVRCDARTFARRVTFARVVAVHNDQRLVYLDPAP